MMEADKIPFQDKMQLVVVGGGYAGCKLVQQMKSICQVTLIDPKDYLFHCIGALRSCVEPSFAGKIFIPYKETFGDKFIRAKVVDIKKKANEVVLDDGRTIPYTHLVLATGTSSPFPGKLSSEEPKLSKEDGIKRYKEYHQEILPASSVICVGGGAVGVEMAGELKTDFPEKKVTLISSSKILVSKRLDEEVQQRFLASMANVGIELLLGERVTNLGDLKLNKFVKHQVVKTSSSRDVKADLIIPCIGNKFESDPFRDALGSAIASSGEIKVDAFFKIEGTTNIYAIGDVVDTNEEKMAKIALEHATLLSENWKAEIKGEEKTPHKTGGPVTMIVPIGRNGGVGLAPSRKLGDAECKAIKSKTMFVERFWGLMEQPVPKSSKF